jgi:hypothetical protein
MTDRSKFEQMLEHLIADEQEKAKELFHQLVVEKSRQIYENILSEDFNEAKDEDEEDDLDETAKDEDEEDLDEAADEEDDEEMDEGFGFAETDDEEGGDVGGDASDDMMHDLGGDDDMGGDDMGDGDIEDRVMDLEDALDELKAEFEKIMGGEEGDDMDGMGGDDMGGDELDMGDDDEEELGDSFGISDNFMREYIEKVSNPKHGDNGANTKSPMAGKNDMGGTTANIAQGGESKGEGTKGGLANPSTKEENFGNVNVPGGNAGKTAFKKKEPGHGAEKKGSGDNGDRSAQSPISGVKSRAK